MEHLDYCAVGRRIKAIRKQKNYTQRELADIADISEKYISEIEGGKKQGRLEIYARIAEALDVSLDEFVKDSYKSGSAVFMSGIADDCGGFGSVRREMLLNFIDFLKSKEEYDK